MKRARKPEAEHLHADMTAREARRGCCCWLDAAEECLAAGLFQPGLLCDPRSFVLILNENVFSHTSTSVKSGSRPNEKRRISSSCDDSDLRERGGG